MRELGKQDQRNKFDYNTNFDGFRSNLQLPGLTSISSSNRKMLSLIIISGRSGSGKSTLPNVLEDSGYFCIDNLPVTLLTPLIKKLNEDDKIDKAAVSIDARTYQRPSFASSLG